MKTADLLSRIHIDDSKPMPVYFQLRHELQGFIEAGNLRPGDSLPTVQEIVRHVGVSTNTVLRAVAALADDGLIVKRRGARSRVTAPRAATTELLFWFSDRPISSHRIASHFHELEDALRTACGASRRRVWASYIREDTLSVPEILSVCRARNADSIVAYKPPATCLPSLREVAESVRVVSLFVDIPDAPIGCILPDPVEALRCELTRRIERGCRHFAYIGELGHYAAKAGPSPYLACYHTFIETLAAAGIEPLAEAQDTFSDGVPFEFVASLPDGAVLMTPYPQLALALDEEQRLDKISYTECRSTLELARGRMTVVYQGLAASGRKAAELVTAHDNRAPQTIRLQPEVVNAHTKGG